MRGCGACTTSPHELDIERTVDHVLLRSVDVQVKLGRDELSDFGKDISIELEREVQAVAGLMVDVGAVHGFVLGLAFLQKCDKRTLDLLLLTFNFFLILALASGSDTGQQFLNVIFHETSSLCCGRNVMNLSKTIVHEMED